MPRSDQPVVAFPAPLRCTDQAKRQRIVCECGKWIGTLLPDGRIVVQHQGRAVIGHIEAIVCRCHAVWRPEQPDDSPPAAA